MNIPYSDDEEDTHIQEEDKSKCALCEKTMEKVSNLSSKVRELQKNWRVMVGFIAKVLHLSATTFSALKEFENKIQGIGVDSLGDYEEMFNFLTKHGVDGNP